ncbi:MAG: serine hydrolase [Pseudomonadota bacterium]
MKTVILLLTILTFGFSANARSLIDRIDKGINDRTDILAVYEGGQLVYEEYRNGYQPKQKHKLWSMSKSLMGLMLGKTVADKRMQLTDSICDHVSVSELSSTSQCNITVEDILFWQSGTAWDETYLGIDGSKSNVLNGLYGEGIKDFSKYYFSLPYLPKIPNGWNYSTGDTHILGYLLKKVYSPMEYEAMPWTLLFDPLGIEDATFERDYEGTYLGGSYIYLSHGDLNKVAQYVLEELKQPKTLPKDWLPNALTAKSTSLFNLDMIKDGVAPGVPGGHWWLNKPTNKIIQAVPWPSAPEDTFAAFGVFGQMMFIIPSMDLVIIRYAQDIRGGFDKDRMLEIIFDHLEEN